MTGVTMERSTSLRKNPSRVKDVPQAIFATRPLAAT